jgi:hypothetical protein
MPSALLCIPCNSTAKKLSTRSNGGKLIDLSPVIAIQPACERRADLPRAARFGCMNDAHYLEEGGTFRRQLFETTSSLSVSGKESVPPGELFLAVAVGFLRRSDSRGSIHRTSQARASNTRVSETTLCPLGQSKKAIGHESQIGPCVATHKWITVRLDVSETNGAVTTVKWNHREEEGSHRFV